MSVLSVVLKKLRPSTIEATRLGYIAEGIRMYLDRVKELDHEYIQKWSRGEVTDEGKKAAADALVVLEKRKADEIKMLYCFLVSAREGGIL